MIQISNVFSEFMELSYTPGCGVPWKGISDMKIKEGIIARKTENGVKVLYLTNGNSLFVPKEWIDLFSQLNAHSGEKILYVNSLPENDKIGTLIYLFLRLVMFIDAEKGEKILSILSDICELGTQEFRNKLEEEYEVSLRPLEFRSLDTNLKI